MLAATSSVLLLRTDGGGGADSRSDRARTGGVGRRETSWLLVCVSNLLSPTRLKLTL